MCNFYAATPGAARLLFGPAGPIVDLVCQPYFDNSVYSGPRPTEETIPGGQCSGVLYVVTGTLTAVLSDCNGGTNTVVINIPSTSTLGPIEITRAVGPQNRCSGKLPGNISFSLKGFSSPGVPETKNLTGVSASTSGVISAQLNPIITPTAPGLDNCGGASGDLVPGDFPPPAPTFPPGLGPGVDPDGQPFFWMPDIPTTNPDGPPINPEPTPPPGGGGGPTESPVAGDPEDGTPGDEDFPEPPEGRRWVGCCIKLTAIPGGTGTVPGTAPLQILTEVVGNARLLFDSMPGDGYDTPVQIRSADLCLWEPVKGLSPKGIRVNLKPNFEYTYTPYSVKDTE